MAKTSSIYLIRLTTVNQDLVDERHLGRSLDHWDSSAVAVSSPTAIVFSTCSDSTPDPIDTYGSYSAKLIVVWRSSRTLYGPRLIWTRPIVEIQLHRMDQLPAAVLFCRCTDTIWTIGFWNLRWPLPICALSLSVWIGLVSRCPTWVATLCSLQRFQGRLSHTSLCKNWSHLDGLYRCIRNLVWNSSVIWVSQEQYLWVYNIQNMVSNQLEPLVAACTSSKKGFSFWEEYDWYKEGNSRKAGYLMVFWMSNSGGTTFVQMYSWWFEISVKRLKYCARCIEVVHHSTIF